MKQLQISNLVKLGCGKEGILKTYSLKQKRIIMIAIREDYNLPLFGVKLTFKKPRMSGNPSLPPAVCGPVVAAPVSPCTKYAMSGGPTPAPTHRSSQPNIKTEDVVTALRRSFSSEVTPSPSSERLVLVPSSSNEALLTTSVSQPQTIFTLQPSSPIETNTNNSFYIGTESLTVSQTTQSTSTVNGLVSDSTVIAQSSMSDNPLSPFELEPSRQDVFSVRRRSRQFFALLEEEEDDTAVTKAEDNVSNTEATVQMKAFKAPVFNLGESLRRLYYPKSAARKNKQNLQMKSQQDNKETFTEETTEDTTTDKLEVTEIALLSGYESDPEHYGGLYKQMNSLRKIRSQTDMNTYEAEEAYKTVTIPDYSKSKSLPATPNLSPRLLRRGLKPKSTSDEEDPAQQGPGYSFLATVAGQLRNVAAKRQTRDPNVVAKLSEKKVVVAQNSQASEAQSSLVVAQKGQVSEAQTKTATPTVTAAAKLTESVAPTTGAPKSSFVKSFVTWGTTQKVKVSEKETAFFSPTSF